MSALLARAASTIAFSATLLMALPAQGQALSASEQERLARGETVTREQTIDDEDRRFVGGVTYTVVEAGVSELTDLLDDVRSYEHLLPRTKRARLVGQRGLDQLVELRQGNAVFDTSYTIRIRHEPWRREVRFWLDPSRPHDIVDAWGFFRVDPLPDTGSGVRSLVTYGVLVNLGPGIVRELFEERLRAVMLSVPQILRRYVAEVRRARGRG